MEGGRWLSINTGVSGLPMGLPAMGQNIQNQNSLLVKRQNDNTSPGDWPRKISP